MSFIRILFFIVVLGIYAGSFGEEYRTFTGSNGKAIEARLISFDPDNLTVQLKMKDGRDQTVLLSLFSDKDQEFIKNEGKTDNPFDDESIEKKSNLSAPKIIKIEPPNGSINLDPDKIKEIRVTFDQDMRGGRSVCTLRNKTFPNISEPKWIGKRTFVAKAALELDSEYGLSFNNKSHNNFKSVEGVSLEPVVYAISTRKSNDYSIKLGKRQTLIRDGQFNNQEGNFSFLPDLQIGFLSTAPKVRALMTVCDWTCLFEGESLSTLRPVKRVLAHGPPNSIDNGYCGVGGTVYDPRDKNRLLAFCHTEDHVGMSMFDFSAIKGFYARVALAESYDNGYSFKKTGAVISSSVPKNANGYMAQGCGDPCAIIDKSKQYYYIYYTDWGVEQKKRGTQLCLARCAIKDKGLPGKWFKYYEGEFKEPGLGGKDTPVVSGKNADAIDGSVVYIKSIDKYVMVYCNVVHAETKNWDGAKESGLYFAVSDNGISWKTLKQIVVGYPACAHGAIFTGRPTLLPMKSNKEGFQGYLLYAYSERWGQSAPNIPHYLVGHQVSFTIERDDQ